jgi:hypothetical protein
MTKEKTLAGKIIFIDNLIDSTFSKKTYLYYRDIIKEMQRLNNIINEIYTKALDTSITSIDLRDYIISSLGSGKNDKRSNN